MKFWYFLRNVIKIIILVVAIFILSDFTAGVDGDTALGIFLFILGTVTVSTTVDLGGGWFLKITTGVGIGGALLGLLLVEVAMIWIAENKVVISGVLLASFILHQIIETVRFRKELPPFFTASSLFCIAMYTVETVLVFMEKPTWLFSMDYQGIGGLAALVMMILTVIFTLVNVIARASQADMVED